MVSQAVAQAAVTSETDPDMFCWDFHLARIYREAGIMAECTYGAAGLYFRRFTEGEVTAYEGALNNITIVNGDAISWDQIIEFRKDPESVRKYRDLRLWLRSGLQAESVGHETDIIGQKIDDYGWAIQKHGFETTIGAFKQLFDWKKSGFTVAAASAAGALAGPVGASIVTGLTIAAEIGVSLVERKLQAKEIERGENRSIAILYDIQQRFGQKQGTSRGS
jgi:hypothetical protein